MESFAAIEKINAAHILTVKDFEDGSISLGDVMEEVNYLKEQIALIRQEMAAFLTGLASINTSRKGAQQVFEENVQRVTAIQKNLDDYVERYRKLTPLLELVDKELSLKIPERQHPTVRPLVAPAGGSVSGPTGSKKPVVQRKRTYNRKSNSSVSGGVATGSEQQPILL